jgi:hypothetical protein
MTRELSQFDRAMAMWREIDFPVIAPQTAELRFVEDLAAMYDNGKVLHTTFAMPDHPDFIAFAAGLLHPTYFFERFWQTKSVAQALPFALHDVSFLSPETFRRMHPVELPGSLANALVRGGAYISDSMPARTAMKCAQDAAESLLAGDFDNPQVFVSHTPWSTFFHDVAWDYTWLIARPGDRRIEVIIATDTD